MKKKFLLAAWMLALPLASNAAEDPGSPVNLILEGKLPEATLLHASIDGGSKEVVEYSLPLVQGKVLSGIHSPVTEARTITLWAEDVRGERLYEGSALLEGQAGFAVPAVLELRSALDGSMAEITLASQRVAIEFAEVRRGESVLTRATANVFDAAGRRVPYAEKYLDWDVEPWVREMFLPCAAATGAALCAEFDSRKFEKIDPRLAACGRRICGVEFIPAPAPVWEKISVGLGDHACALKRDGSAWCWGSGKNGQLGFVGPDTCSDRHGQSPATAPCSRMPLQLPCSGAFCHLIDISAGREHTCAIDLDHNAWCWGGNGLGEGGHGDRDARPDGRAIPIGSPVPRGVVGGHQFKSIRAGSNATCALTMPDSAGRQEVYCWGVNVGGIVPDGTQDLYMEPMRVDLPTDVEALDFRQGHACARRQQGDLLCWGSNSEGPIVPGMTSLSPSARFCRNCPAAPIRMQDTVTPALTGASVTVFSTGVAGTCASTTSGGLPCWGRGIAPFPTGVSVDRVSRGFAHYCTITRGDVFCAGKGLLGDGKEHTDSAPVLVPPLHFYEIDAGNEFTCGIAHDQQVYCWGANDFGQTGTGGIGGVVDRPAPVFMLQSLTPARP